MALRLLPLLDFPRKVQSLERREACSEYEQVMEDKHGVFNGLLMLCIERLIQASKLSCLLLKGDSPMCQGKDD